MTARVEVVEVGPRDGLQNEAKVLDVGTRVELINRLVDRGVRRVEAVSFVRPDVVPQMAGAEEVMAQLTAERRTEVTYIGLVLNRRGADRAAAAQCDEINVVVPVTDEFAGRNQNATVDQLLEHAGAAVAVARQADMSVSVTLSAAFGCPFSGEVSTDQVRSVYDRVADLGVDEVAFGDTIGVGVPAQVHALAALVRDDERVPRLRFHFHNTRNTGYVNAWAATAVHGVGDVALDASVGGFGGCPFAPAATGNIATEDLGYLLRRDSTTSSTGSASSTTGLDLDDLEGLAGVARWLAGHLGTGVPGLLARAGDFPAADERATLALCPGQRRRGR